MDHLCLHICICHTLPAGERNQITCDQMHRVTEAEVARDSGHMMAWFISQLAEDGDVEIPHRKITPFLPCPTQAMTMQWNGYMSSLSRLGSCSTADC